MKELKLKKERVDFRDAYYPSQGQGIFEHCCGNKILTSDNIEYYAPIFEAHGYKLLTPYTLEESDIIYRVSDGLQFIKRGDGLYRTAGDAINSYEFWRLDDPYNFTSNKSEL